MFEHHSSRAVSSCGASNGLFLLLLAVPIWSPGLLSVSPPPSCSLGELSSFVVRFWSPYLQCQPFQLSISTHKHWVSHSQSRHPPPHLPPITRSNTPPLRRACSCGFGADLHAPHCCPLSRAPRRLLRGNTTSARPQELGSRDRAEAGGGAREAWKEGKAGRKNRLSECKCVIRQEPQGQPGVRGSPKQSVPTGTFGSSGGASLEQPRHALLRRARPTPSLARTRSCQRGAQLKAADSPSAGLQRIVGGEAAHDSASSSHRWLNPFIIVAMEASRAPLGPPQTPELNFNPFRFVPLCPFSFVFSHFWLYNCTLFL